MSKGINEEEQVEKTNRTTQHTPMIAQSNSQADERGLGQEEGRVLRNFESQRTSEISRVIDPKV